MAIKVKVGSKVRARVGTLASGMYGDCEVLAIHDPRLWLLTDSGKTVDFGLATVRDLWEEVPDFFEVGGVYSEARSANTNRAIKYKILLVHEVDDPALPSDRRNAFAEAVDVNGNRWTAVLKSDGFKSMKRVG